VERDPFSMTERKSYGPYIDWDRSRYIAIMWHGQVLGSKDLREHNRTLVFQDNSGEGGELISISFPLSDLHIVLDSPNILFSTSFLLLPAKTLGAEEVKQKILVSLHSTPIVHCTMRVSMSSSSSVALKSCPT